MSIGRNGILLLAGILFVLPVTAQTRSPWTDYFGSHYSARLWGGSIRDHRYGIQVDGGVPAPIDPVKVAGLAETLATHDALLIVGGLGSAREQDKVNDYMNAVVADSGFSWRAAVYDWAVTLAPLQGEHSIYVQIGNEISSRTYSETLHSWLADGVPPSAYDSSIIPLYVEYYLAPTVAMLQKAGLDTRQTIKIVLGSITNYSNSLADEWLDELLNYEVVGTFAKSLAGRQVNELIDIVAIHYLMGAKTDHSSYWRTALDQIDDTWIREGRIEGVWATEEVGKSAAEQGRGAGRALRAMARYLSWWRERRFSVDQGRCFFWGSDLGPEGTRVDDALQRLYDFVGSVALIEVPNAVVPNAGLEGYMFQAPTRKGVVVVFANEDTQLSQFEMSENAWNGSIYATARIFTPEGEEVVALTVYRDGGVYVLAFPSEISLTTQDAVLVEITR